MGKQTAVVMVAFVALHVALVLQIISVSTSSWVEGTLQKNYTEANSTNQTTEVKKGLWVACEDDDCSHLNKTLQPDWYPACQALSVIGTGGTLIALVMYYVFVIVSVLPSAKCHVASTTLIQTLATCVFVAFLAVFGVKALDDTDDFGDHFDFEFGWSYYVGIAGAVAAFVAWLASCREVCLVWSDRAGYENI